jgi:hypothetical protein
MPLTANPYTAAKMIFDGGHSGHVTAVGESCVVFWADDWVDGGGVDGLGTGKAVLVNSVAANGRVGKKVRVAAGRAWWPQIAGSDRKACLVWQKFVPNKTYADLYFALYDPATHTFSKRANLLQHHQLYYHYSVAYLPDISRFLIVASKDAGAGADAGRRSGGGRAWLIDNDGNIVAQRQLADGIIREANIIVNGTTAVIARLKAGESVFAGNSERGALGGLMVLSLTSSSINVSQIIDDDYAWQYIGFDGFFSDATHVYTAALSKKGLRTRIYTIRR